MTPEKQDEIRRSMGLFNKEEIIEICMGLLKNDGFVITDEAFPKASYKEIEAAMFFIINKGQYMIDKTPYEERWVLRKNPSFELNKAVKTTNILQHKILKITVGLAALTLIVQIVNIGISLSNQEKQKDLQKQLNNLKPPIIRIDSVVVRQTNIDTPIRRKN